MAGEIEHVKIDNEDTTPLAHSLWHCQQLCSLYDDCVWFSWKVGNGANAASGGM